MIYHILLIIVNLIYGVSFIVASHVLKGYLPSEIFVFVRLFGATILFSLLNLIFVRQGIKKKDIFSIILCGFLGACGNQYLFFKGLSLTSPTDGAIIMTFAPVLTFVFSVLLTREKITSLKIIGLIIGFIGAVLFILPDEKTIDSHTWGNIFVFLNASLYSGYLVLVKRIMKTYNPITAVNFIFLFATLLFSPFGIYAISVSDIDIQTIPSHIIFEIIFVIVCTTCITYLFNITAIKKLGPTVSSSYIYIQPLTTIVLVEIYNIYTKHHWVSILSTSHIFYAVLLFTGVLLIIQGNTISALIKKYKM